jgi:sigma-B regulation protein RsbU (phosphoserine phosphatase)
MANKPEEVEPALNRLDQILEEAGLSAEDIHDLRLVSEELLVNTVSYGYESGVDDTLVVEVELKGDRRLVLTFKDEAREFNPLEQAERDPLDERLGGWGIPLMKELTDGLKYQRQGMKNVMTVEKLLLRDSNP